eukprot:comp9427_c0_seq1/m.4479 comp9427_c0_seq1/g.4479  ORF comp9427_c0_seq1/g.4479 comp9427_c0_seq1/m.4479 type:complete len:207 (-) comp9427_c0_seq1:105-725(-)
MGQGWNPVAVRTAVSVLTTRRSLAVPHFSVKDISHIDFSALHKGGCRAIVFDKDNCLTAPYALEIYPTIKDAFTECRRVFGNNVAIVSNSAGSKDDTNMIEAEKLEGALGVQVIRHGKKKPEGGNELLSQLGLPSSSVVFVGDRLLTDVVFGNMNGMLTIHTMPLTLKGDNTAAKWVRRFENTLLRNVWLRGVKPPPHPLAGLNIN